MTDIPLLEMGDVGSALQLLLRTHASYVRGGEGVTRAQIEVAEKALAAEINRYVRGPERQLLPCGCDPNRGTCRVCDPYAP